MKNRILLLCIFVFSFTGVIRAQKTTLAVLDFKNHCFMNAEEYEPLTRGLADIMISELSKIQSVQIVERQEMKRMMDELKLAQSGMISDESTIQVGNMLGAKNLVFGGFMVTPDNKMRIDTRIVEVETGLTLQAAEATGKSKETLSLINKLSEKLLKDLDVKLSGDDKKRLSKGQKLDIKAVVYYSHAVAFEDQGEYEKARKLYQYVLKLEPKFEQAKLKLARLDSM